MRRLHHDDFVFCIEVVFVEERIVIAEAECCRQTYNSWQLNFCLYGCSLTRVRKFRTRQMLLAHFSRRIARAHKMLVVFFFL